jgi:parallel beta-helix repeat protein
MATDVQSASYVIYIDSSGNTNARNGTTGNVDYSGTSSVTVIQDAISALTSGGRLFFRNGTYTLTGSTPLTVSNADIRLEGESYGAVITQANSTNLAHLIRVTAGFCTLRSLHVDGNASNQTSGTSLVIFDVGGSDASLSQVWMLNAKGHALFINAGVQRVQVKGCYFNTAGNRGINIPNSASVYNVDSSVIGCYFGAITGFGIGAVFCQNLVIGDNVFVGGSTSEPINLDSCQQCTIIGNTIRDSPDSGIVVDNDSGGDCTGISIVGNTVVGSQYDGIYVVTSDSAGVTNKVSVAGNVCRNNGKDTTGAHAGIHIYASKGSISDCTIVGNCCNDDQSTKTQNYGIWEQQGSGLTASDDLVVGNDCIGNAGTSGNPVDILLASSANGTKLAWCLGRYTSQGSA